MFIWCYRSLLWYGYVIIDVFGCSIDGCGMFDWKGGC